MDYQYRNIIERLERLPAEKQSYILDALPRHLIAGGQVDRAVELLTDYGFLTVKCSRVSISALPDGELRYRGVYDLINDYQELLSAVAYDNERVRKIAELYELSFRDSAHILVRWPDLTFQEIYSRIRSMQESEIKGGHASWWKVLLDLKLKIIQFLRTNAARYRRVMFDKPTRRVPAFSAPNLSTETSSIYHSKNIWLEHLNTPLPQNNFIKCFGHVGKINSMEFFHDGRIISFGEDGTARIWETTNGKEIREIRFCGHELADGKLAADQTWGIALCHQCGVFRFRVASGDSRNIRILLDNQLQQNETDFRTCHFVPNTSSNVVLSKGDTLWIVDLENPTSPVPLRANLQEFSSEWYAPHLPDDFADRMLNESFGEITCVALDSGSMCLLASYSVGGAIQWDLISQKVTSYIPLAWQVLNIAFQPKKARTGWLLGCLNPAGPHLMCVDALQINSGSYEVFAAEKLLQFPWCVSHTGDYAAFTESLASQLVVRQLGDSTISGEIIFDLENHNGKVTCAAFAPDGSHVASAGEDGVIQIWPLAKTPRPVDNPPDNIFDCYVLDNPGHIAQLVQRRRHTSELLMKYYTLPEYKYEYEQPMLNHEAFGSAAGGPRLKPMALLSREGNTTACVTPLESGELWGWALGVWRWVMKQSFLPIRALTPLLQIWDTQTGVKLFKDILVGIAPGDWPIDAAISRNGQVIATLSERGLVTIVDINEKEPVHLGALEHLHHITVDQSEDNIIVFALSEDTLLQFDPASLEFEVLWTSVSKTRLTTFCILPDLQHVLIGDNNGRFVILDISKDRSPQTLATWQAHKGSVRSCVVDINGRICVSAGDDLLIRMWDLQDQNEISKAPIEAPIASLAFWEKGGIIGATDQTHRFYAWQLKEFSFTGNE